MSTIRSWSDRIAYLVATAGGAGAIPFAPGTWGAAVGALIFLAIQAAPLAWQSYLLWMGLLLASFATIAVGPWAEAFFQRKDPSAVVLDEVAGLLLTLSLFHIPGAPLLTLLWAFPVTRVFDILKPPPARRLEKLPYGWGVLLDDLASSLYAAAALWLVRIAMPHWFPLVNP
jgi:phosphatidylglycerophosphatase A